MVGPGGQRGEGEPPSHRHGDRAGGGRAVAQLARPIRPPTVGCSASGPTTGVIVASDHCGEGQCARDGYGDRTRGGRAVAQLSLTVVAPAVRRPAGGETAAMIRRGAQRGEGKPTGYPGRE